MARPKVNLLKALRQKLPRDGSLLIAVSGGVDSMALLHGCHELSTEYRLKLGVAHVDHGLRETSGGDAQFVESITREYGMPFFLHTAPPPAKKVNIEEWGRRLRYNFFSEVLSNQSFELVVTAHHADDVAETFLMRIFSNKEPRSIQQTDPQRNCLRPLLGVSRVHIEEYFKEKGLSHVEDPTNQESDYLRNRVRNRLIPLLAEEYDKRIVETLASRAMSIADDIDFLESLTDAAYNRVSLEEFGSKAWLFASNKEVQKLSDQLRWRFARRLVKDLLGFNLGKEKAKDLSDFIISDSLQIELPMGVSLRRRSGGIIVERSERSD